MINGVLLIIAAVLFAVLYLFVQQVGGNYSRMIMFTMGILYVVMGYITRILWKKVLKKTRRQGNRSLLIVCTKANAEKTIQNIRDNDYNMYRISGLVLMDSPTSTPVRLLLP